MAYHIEIPVQTDITAERRYADAKYGVHDYTDEFWLSLLQRELGRAADKLLLSKKDARERVPMRSELVRVAATAIAWIEAFDRLNAIEEARVSRGD